MATDAQWALLRRDTGMTVITLDNTAAEQYFQDAATDYPTGSASVITAATRVAVLRGMLASYATQVSYTQNQESVDQSDAFKNLMALLSYWEKKLAAALEDDADGVVGSVAPPPSGTIRLRPVW